MALIITLILLSVTLIMAVAFLALSRRERNSVTTATDTTVARLATESALAAAQAQMAANILATGGKGAYDYHLLVSTNYISPAGYDPKAGPAANGVSATNVNYDFTADNSAYSVADMEQNIANLWLLPRAPVMVSATEPYAGRFYLDLNQNGVFETNNPTHTTPGDPEWIGVLEHPDQPHGPNNHFVSRYAFLAQPAGNSLDLNYIHNQVWNQSLNANDGYMRNQGVGSWELNLAAFLADLNTNVWDNVLSPYFYGQWNGNFNTGASFDDSRSLLSWRYNYNYNNLYTVNQLFGNPLTFKNDAVDGYSDGPLQTTVDTNADFVADNPALPWAGSDNPNRFFALTSDLFGGSGSLGNFTAHLKNISQSYTTASPANADPTNDYNRYTFYRLLDQLGTDSKADAGKLNVNFRNVTNGFIVAGMETNLSPWAAGEFFTNAANLLLTTYTADWWAADKTANHFYFTNTFGVTATGPFGVTNIPVFINGQFVYSAAVNRLLQLAANIFDATTTNQFPSVFRPVFSSVTVNGYRNVYISGYAEVSSLPSLSIGTPPLDTPVDITATGLNFNAPLNGTLGNVFGVPWIVGAKKGLPNFNQLSMVNALQVTRKLLVTRTAPSTSATYSTNQMYVFGITNNIGVSFWNSYENDYPRPLTVYAADTLMMTMTNLQGVVKINGTPLSLSANFVFSPPISSWPGSHWGYNGTAPTDTPQVNSFVATNWSFQFLPDSIYRFTSASFEPVNASSNPVWETTTPNPLPELPQMGLLTTNWFQGIILDGNHVIDYVQLRGPGDSWNINGQPALADLIYPQPDNVRLQWSTNQSSSTAPPAGVLNQLAVSANSSLAPGKTWIRPPTMPNSIPSDTKNPGLVEAEFFGGFFTSIWFDTSPGTVHNRFYTNTALWVQAPYTPSRTVYDYTLWTANDPLVHYLSTDLNYVDPSTMGLQKGDQAKSLPSVTTYLTALSDRYQPWGRNKQVAAQGAGKVDADAYNMRYRDPAVWHSDQWDFPTNPLPTVGWLGRVHRGTPWQTVYLKSSDLLLETNALGQLIGGATWAAWSGNQNYFDTTNSAPMQDRRLFDLFTTRFNDNAVRGALSVNQQNLAAWSAAFSGLVVLTNNTSAPVQGTLPACTNWVIDPAGPAGAGATVGLLVSNINSVRQTFTNTDGLVGVFEHTGDILSVPALTEASPFLNTSSSAQLQNGISDAMYEWLPQQTLGLLRVGDTPRYVVYCFGQTLRPAANSLVLDSGQFFGLCTNYQVTAESAARAVVRLDRHITVDANGNTGTNYTPVVESYNPLPPQ